MRGVNSFPIVLMAVGLLLALPSCKCQRETTLMDELGYVPAIDQRQLKVEPAKDRFVVANFWATWCGPCIQETPSLFRMAAEHKDKITLVSISVDSGITEVKKFLSLYPNSQAPNVYVIHDRGKRLAEKFAVTRYPETFIFTSDGKLVEHIPGAVDWSQPEILKIFGL